MGFLCGDRCSVLPEKILIPYGVRTALLMWRPSLTEPSVAPARLVPVCITLYHLVSHSVPSYSSSGTRAAVKQSASDHQLARLRCRTHPIPSKTSLGSHTRGAKIRLFCITLYPIQTDERSARLMQHGKLPRFPLLRHCSSQGPPRRPPAPRAA